jgi:hypothetical protein
MVSIKVSLQLHNSWKCLKPSFCQTTQKQFVVPIPNTCYLIHIFHTKLIGETSSDETTTDYSVNVEKVYLQAVVTLNTKNTEQTSV